MRVLYKFKRNVVIIFNKEDRLKSIKVKNKNENNKKKRNTMGFLEGLLQRMRLQKSARFY
jgi:hypothetical protein